jgi:type I restriction enzyme, R subunit
LDSCTRVRNSVQVIEELIALAKDISVTNARSAEWDLRRKNWRSTTRLQRTVRAKALTAHEQLRVLAQILVPTIGGSATIDQEGECVGKDVDRGS